MAAIEGPAGIGKTELLASLGRLASGQGFRVLRARGRELEAGMPFAVAGQLFGPAIASATKAECRHMLAGPACMGAGALGLAAGAAPDSEFLAVHGLYWLCVNIAERAPLVLAVDDLQWADGPSLAWLGYFGRRAAELPVLLVVSVREGDPGARAPSVLAVLEDAATRRMRLPPLSAQGVTALVRARLGQSASDGFCSACWELAGGNPLHVAELLAAARSEHLTGSDADIGRLRSAAPSAVGGSILTRLARAGPAAAALARALAVLGAQTEVATAAELAGLAVAAAELTADELAAAQILAPARPLDFFHPLILQAVYADIALGARRLAHRRGHDPGPGRRGGTGGGPLACYGPGR